VAAIDEPRTFMATPSANVDLKFSGLGMIECLIAGRASADGEFTQPSPSAIEN
jgi:hypothetical protein